MNANLSKINTPLHARILCVDDNRDSVELLGTMLHQADDTYSVTAISHAEEALKIMERQTFDLYILDYALPEISGVELCRKVRERNKQTPIMFFTAMARADDQAEAIRAGADEYLVKPNDLAKLTETVERRLNKKCKVGYKRKSVSRRRCTNII